MFDPSPEIKKIERVAAKFSSAEEEAALRKKELTTLKQTNAPRMVLNYIAYVICCCIGRTTIQIHANFEKDDFVPDENPLLHASFDSASISNTESNCSDSTYVPAWRLSSSISISSSMSMDLYSGQEDAHTLSTPRHSEGEGDSNHSQLLCNSAVKVGGKRNSILTNANQEMLSTLNKMLSPPDGGPAAGCGGGGGLSINLNATMPLPQLGFMAGGRSVNASRSRTPSALTRRGSVAALPTTATVDDKPKEPKKSQSKKKKEEVSKQQENKENAGSFANTGQKNVKKC